MHAIVMSGAGGPEVLQLRDVPTPEPGPGRIRVRVEASGINRADLLQRRGGYPAPAGWPSDIPGLEYAGTVDALGEGVTLWTVGDRVMGLVGGGGYAEAVVVDQRQAIRVPDSLSWEEAAAVPETFITADDALFSQLGVAEGETLLVHAVGSGVGTAALQLAKAAGLVVLGTGRSAWKLERASGLGLDVAIDTTAEDFAEAALRETGGRGVHAVLDLVGGSYLDGNVRALAPLGRLVIVGLVGGRTAELDMGAVLRKRLRLVGTSLRTRSDAEKAGVARVFSERVLPLLAEGRVRPIVDRVFPAADAADAHRELEANRNFGKVVLRW